MLSTWVPNINHSISTHTHTAITSNMCNTVYNELHYDKAVQQNA